MNLIGKSALIILAVTILTYGLPTSSLAQENGTDIVVKTQQTELPLTVETDSDTYQRGDSITITGKVRTIDELLTPHISIIIYDSDKNRICIDQVALAADGSYRSGLCKIADGAGWNKSGEYEVVAQYGFAQDISTKFQFTAGELPPTLICPPGQTLQGDVCIEITCDAGKVLDGNDCVDLTCPPGQEIVGDECVDEALDCPPGTHEEDGVCVADAPTVTCAAGQTIVNGVCTDPKPNCGPGTHDEDGVCVADVVEDKGCLIATAAYGSELAPQVQFLREIRDNTLLSTESGSSFMTGFNTIYYSFSPAVADLERESPAFREAVKLFITPMLSTLSIMTLADQGSESQVLALGISVIALNLGMYIAAPAVIGFKVRSCLKSRK